jgi:2-methylcitrate dehydratase
MDLITQNLVNFTHTLTYDHLNPKVIHETKRRIIDSVGCAFGAFGSDVQTIVHRAAKLNTLSLSGPPSSGLGGRVIGLPEAVSLDSAVFANGALIRYLDYNDTYLAKEPAHPSDNLAATLTVAAAKHRTGKDLILATVIAYEIQCRFCDVASLRAKGWDHPTYGPYSSSLGAAKLLGATETQMNHIVGIAGVCNNAMRQTRVGHISMWKACAFAAAARGGVNAAVLGTLGFTGPSDIFTGVMGFQKQVSGPFSLPVLATPPETFMLEKTYIKDHPAEYHSQSAIDVAKKMHPKIKDWTRIREIVVDSHDASVDIIGSEPEKWHPKDKETADHSLPYITAVALKYGDVRLEHFTPAYFENKDLMNLVQKVKVERDKRFSALYGDSFGNRVTVRFEDGTELKDEALYPKGHPKNPHTDPELEAKFRSQTSDVLPKAQQDALLAKLWNLDAEGDCAKLFDLMVGPRV